MKILTLKQPHAELILSGRKTVELRKKHTKFRGEFLIHAAKTPDIRACRLHGMDPNELTHGAIVGKATLYSVKEYLSKKGFLSDKHRHLALHDFDNKLRYGLLLKGAERLKSPIPMGGTLNFTEANVEA